MCCPLVFEFSVGIGGFVIGLGQISFFFSFYPFVISPRGDAGGLSKSRIRPPYPQRVVKGD